MSNVSADPPEKLRVLELFAGIGGLHWAMKVASVECEVIAAMEINPIVLETYEHNFGSANVFRKNLEGITANEINELNVDAIVMSPPCQPFCRTGNRLDTQDSRTGPLTRLTEILPKINFKFIFVENVQGFEVSTARGNLLDALRKLDFKWQEFMLTPKTVGVPNSRLRYYLIGKKADCPWSFETHQENLLTEIPNWNEPDNMPFAKLKRDHESMSISRRKRWQEFRDKCNDYDKRIDDLPYCVGDIIDWNLSEEDISKFRVSESVINKYLQAMDIVTQYSSSTCCFTKGYGHYVKGTGSILNTCISCDSKETESDNSAKPCSELTLRYFTPTEISRLMSYPEEFKLPPHLTLNQKYKSLGNSVNVYVVAILFTLLFS